MLCGHGTVVIYCISSVYYGNVNSSVFDNLCEWKQHQVKSCIKALITWMCCITCVCFAPVMHNGTSLLKRYTLVRFFVGRGAILGSYSVKKVFRLTFNSKSDNVNFTKCGEQVPFFPEHSLIEDRTFCSFAVSWHIGNNRNWITWIKTKTPAFALNCNVSLRQTQRTNMRK